MTLNWRGAQIRAQIVEALTDGLTEVGLRVESAAKRRLSPGHGVLTGTLRRSIHAAGPDYNFAGDNVAPSAGSPERGGSGQAEVTGNKVVVEVGTGMVYGGIIEGYYGYMQGGFDEVQPHIISILEDAGKAAGL